MPKDERLKLQKVFKAVAAALKKPLARMTGLAADHVAVINQHIIS
jgi:hypothetical protein